MTKTIKTTIRAAQMALPPPAPLAAPTPLAAVAAQVAVSVAGSTTTSASQRVADLALQPTMGAAAIVQAFLGSSGGDLSVPNLIGAVKSSIDELAAGNMSRPEAMLLAQAHALQAIFVDQAQRAARSDRPEHKEAHFRVALKAQNQCRMTIETLSTVKNPPVVFARQANISHGPQQVNNVPAQAARSDSHAEI